jgi:hypothetical protein
MGKGKTVTAKKKCCKDQPRCKACPVVLKRIADAGFAERVDLRTYARTGKPPKPVVAAARAR